MVLHSEKETILISVRMEERDEKKKKKEKGKKDGF